MVHGDFADGVMQHARWLAYVGDAAYDFVLWLNRHFNNLRARLGFCYWSLSQYLKHRVKNAVSFITDFETVLMREARRRGYDGVVCGHIHKAEVRTIDGLLYCNDGDWVESLTALVETLDGELKIVTWDRILAPNAAGAALGRTGRDRRRGGGTARMKLLVVSDAWHPQVNGVVRTIEATNRELALGGHTVVMIAPNEFTTVPCPRYGEIRLSLFPYRRVAQRIAAERPDAIHLATEGPLGQAARRYCVRHGLPFTTAYHTRFPQYLKAMFGIPESWVYGFLRRFHGAATHVLSPTVEIDRDLAAIGLTNIARWTRGVDLDVFKPNQGVSPHVAGLKGPVFLYVGRVSVEKNIEAFLEIDLPGSRVVAGIGPDLRRLQARYPDVHFVGVLPRAELARLYASARCVRVPEPHRHLRPGDARGARLRHAGGGLPGAGAARRRRQQRRSGAGCRPAPRCAPCTAHRPHALPAVRGALLVECGGAPVPRSATADRPHPGGGSPASRLSFGLPPGEMRRMPRATARAAVIFMSSRRSIVADCSNTSLRSRPWPRISPRWKTATARPIPSIHEVSAACTPHAAAWRPRPVRERRCSHRWRARSASPAAPHRAQARPLLGFASVPVSTADTVTVPEGYTPQVIAAWGEPIGLSGENPAFKFDGSNTAAEQEAQFGMHHDGIALLSAGRQPARACW